MAQKQSQFMHIELYSRAGGNKQGKTSSGAVIAEAVRELGFTDHIIKDGFKPEPPKYLFSQNDLSLEKHYENMLQQLATEKDLLGRKIKTDQNILLAGVVSYPKPRIGDNWTADDKQNYLLFKEQTTTFLQKKWGENLFCIIEHNDEQYPHLHFYASNKTRIASAPALHPGHFARLKIKNEAKQNGESSEKKLEAEAYKVAMCSFQDDFFNEVGMHCGFTRLGPKAQRLNRTEWKERKRVAKTLAKAYKVLKENVQKSNENSMELNKSLAEVGLRIDEILAMQNTLGDDQKQLEVDREKIESNLADLELAKFVRENHEDIAKEFRLKKFRTAASIAGPQRKKNKI